MTLFEKYSNCTNMQLWKVLSDDDTPEDDYKVIEMILNGRIG